MNHFLEILKEKGFSITRPRREILNVLSTSPLSVHEIEEKLKEKKAKIDLVTIYRTLQIFIKLGIVSKIQFEEKNARYELVIGQKHHHHVVCQSCGTVEDVNIEEKKLIKQAENQSKFTIRKHALEFFGLCLKCQ